MRRKPKKMKYRGFEPMKVELDPSGRGGENSPRGRNRPSASYPRAERICKTARYRKIQETTSSEEKESEMTPRFARGPSSVFGPMGEIGPRDSVPQLSTRIASNSETKKAKRNTTKSKGPKKKRNRRARPEQVLKAADVQKHTVKKNIEAEKLWGGGWSFLRKVTWGVF